MGVSTLHALYQMERTGELSRSCVGECCGTVTSFTLYLNGVVVGVYILVASSPGRLQTHPVNSPHLHIVYHAGRYVATLSGHFGICIGGMQEDSGSTLPVFHGISHIVLVAVLQYVFRSFLILKQVTYTLGIEIYEWQMNNAVFEIDFLGMIL